MKTVKVKIDGFSGHIEMRYPLRGERRKLKKETGFNEVIQSEDIDKVQELYENSEEMILKYVEEVKLTHISSKTKVKDLKEIEDYREYDQIMPKLFNTIMHGPSLGE